jgi:hypothetical protein
MTGRRSVASWPPLWDLREAASAIRAQSGVALPREKEAFTAALLRCVRSGEPIETLRPVVGDDLLYLCDLAVWRLVEEEREAKRAREQLEQLRLF